MHRSIEFDALHSAMRETKHKNIPTWIHPNKNCQKWVKNRVFR